MSYVLMSNLSLHDKVSNRVEQIIYRSNNGQSYRCQILLNAAYIDLTKTEDKIPKI